MLIYLRSIVLLSLLLAMAASQALAGNGNAGGTFPGANGQPFQALQGQINDLGQRLAQASVALQAQISALQLQVANNSADIQDLKTHAALTDSLIAAIRSELLVVRQQLALNSADIDLLKQNDLLHDQLFTAMDARIRSLDARITASEGDIAALIQRDQILQQMITAINAQLASLSNRVSTNSIDISYLNSQTASLQSRLSAAEAQLLAKQNRISQACPAGSSIREIFANGSVTCQPDNVASGVGTLVVHNEWTAVSNGSYTGFITFDVRATCPSTYRLTGGGYSVSNDLTFVFTSWGEGGQTWLVTARGTWPVTTTVYSDAYCARVQ